MPCLACGRPGGPICGGCDRRLRRPSERVLPDGVVGSACWVHTGPARALVHRLKYHGLLAVAEVAAEQVPPPAGATCLVPVPRVVVRTVAFGVDPAAVFAGALGDAWGLPVLDVLRAPFWSPRRAGRRHRAAPPRLVNPAGRLPGSVVVDDVITTGATVAVAARLVGARSARAITMTAGDKSPRTAGPTHTMRGRDSK